MNNTPVFLIMNGIKFPDFIHSQKPDPGSGLRNLNVIWDFFNSPESLHQVTALYLDRGMPASWRNMDGYSGHTFKWANKKGEAYGSNISLRQIRGSRTYQLSGPRK